LLDQKDDYDNSIKHGGTDGEEVRKQEKKLQALILTPTRELAIQIQVEASKLLCWGGGDSDSEWMSYSQKQQGSSKQWIGSIVGGLAHVKQARVLDKDRPAVLVGTVGRLWELVSVFLRLCC
jgi:superfamily II DNA/RNA helicase